MEQAIVQVDGSCSPNPGQGSWAVFCESTKAEDAGYSQETTNNKMELMAILQALLIYKGIRKLTIKSDSQYAVNTSLKTWKAKVNLDILQ